MEYKEITKKIQRQKDMFLKNKKLYNESEEYHLTVDYTNQLNKTQNLKSGFLFESFSGTFVSSSISFFINYYRHIYPNEEFYIVGTENYEFSEEFINQYDLKIVRKDTAKYLSLLTKIKYIVTDYSLPTYFIRNRDQIVIHTTEGIADFSAYPVPLTNEQKVIQRSLFQSTHILFQNSKNQEEVIKNYNLDGIFNGKVLCGLNYYEHNINNNTLSNVIKMRDEKSLTLVLKQKHDDNEKRQLKVFIQELINKNFNKYKINLFVNPSEYSLYNKDSFFNKFLVEYSGYIEKAVLTNDIIYSENESLLDNLQILNTTKKFLITINKEAEEIECHEYKNSKSIESFILSEINDLMSLPWKSLKNEKKTIVMYCGGFLNNGITSSAINLSNQIDYNKYNLIVMDKANYNEESEANIQKLNSKTKIIYRVGQSNLTLRENFAHDFIISRRGMRNWLKIFNPSKIYQREMKRLIGSTRVDVVIDFSGYVPFWSALFAFSNAHVKTIYQHNDLLAEMNKKIDNKFKHKYILPRVFSLYKYFDNIVSVASYTKELNATNLKKYASYNKFKVVNNSLSIDDILYKKDNNEYDSIVFNDKNYVINNKLDFGSNAIINLKPVPSKENINFITIGRLSPEKDHMKLLYAFSDLLTRTNKNNKLYILGDGILREQIENAIVALSLQDNVIMMGQVNNPFYYLNLCDCFILSSNHEGQPMVLLEALTIGTPIIATDIAGNRSVLETTNELLVENSREGLAKGMESFVNSNLTQTKQEKNQYFDFNNYNQKSLHMFYKNACSKY